MNLKKSFSLSIYPVRGKSEDTGRLECIPIFCRPQVFPSGEIKLRAILGYIGVFGSKRFSGVLGKDKKRILIPTNE
jgi:hypothetical protein